ncbi:hypothetical protein IPZ58_25000 [Streptomyces roseoverticillatus]|uniref:hypothetical protein n=1 Tax=Streptomyces roseoverticillatus TaxID=66429 RepID=UPI001F3A37D1|nr:hypothetical protein [Streptomyces roseoverticillatus]MCF3104827.1 hypothetical protein [Streptomyces roseoverticillatus]
MHPTTRRAATLCAATAVAALCGIVPAQAADGPAAPAATDFATAQKVLRSGLIHDTVARFLTAAAERGGVPADGADGGMGGGAPQGPAQAPSAATGFDLKKPVPLYELSPEFVTGKTRATAGSALKLSYLASRVSAANGRQAAVLLAPGQGGGQDGRGWQLAGIRDGDADISAAERGTEQAQTFMEPQIHGWYRLTGGSVEPLNKEARTALQGKPRVSLAAYQQLVAKRYGDKLPGSAYDRKGLAGGYALAEDQAEDQATTTSSASSRSWLPAASGAAALAVSGAAVLQLRRRRKSTAR